MQKVPKIEMVDEVTAEILRRMTPMHRLAIAYGMFERARNMLRLNLAREHPDWDELQLREAVLRRIQYDSE